MSSPLPDVANLGDPGHIADHNLLTAAIAAKAPSASPTFTGTVNLTGATVTGLPAAGLTWIATGTVGGGSSLSMNNCFSAAYDWYLLLIYANVTGVTLRWRSGGTDNTAAEYFDQWMVGQGTGIAAQRNSSATSHSLAGGVGDGHSALYVYNPFVPTYTFAHGSYQGNYGANLYAGTQGHFHASGSASFDGFTLIGSSITAQARVYGHKNS
jgi:hypothetical protein